MPLTFSVSSSASRNFISSCSPHTHPHTHTHLVRHGVWEKRKWVCLFDRRWRRREGKLGRSKTSCWRGRFFFFFSALMRSHWRWNICTHKKAFLVHTTSIKRQKRSVLNNSLILLNVFSEPFQAVRSRVATYWHFRTVWRCWFALYCTVLHCLRLSLFSTLCSQGN